MTHPVKSPRKLIEVALPLDAINVAAAREKSIRHGHPSTLHLWWARRPLAAGRAVIFAQLVNDPGYQQGGGFKYGKNKKEAAIERKDCSKLSKTSYCGKTPPTKKYWSAHALRYAARGARCAN